MKLSPLALAIALTPGLALAADETSSSAQLPPMVITRATNLKAPTPASVAVIDREQIEASASSDLLDVLRSQAGVQIRDIMGDGKRAAISLRGFGENAINNTLVLVDGRRLNQPALAGPDLNSVPLSNIERIEIIRGAGTVLYGDQAVGGVINIVTRTPDTREAYLEASRGSHDLEAYRGHIFQPLGAGFSVYASGETRNSDGYRDHNNANYSSAFARLRYDHGNGHVLYEYQTVDDELLYPGYLTAEQQRQDRKRSVTINSSGYNNSKTQVHRIALEQSLSDTWTANFDYSHSDQDGVGELRYDDFAGGVFLSPFTQDLRTESFSPRLTGRWYTGLGQTEWLLGHDHITSDYQSSATNVEARQTQRDWYSQISQALGHGLNLSLGYRASEVEDREAIASKHQTDREDSTSIGLSWQANDNLKAFIKREDVLRWANVEENGWAANGVDFLKPQTGESWEGGLEWADSQQRYRASVYRLDLKNEIMYDALATAPSGGLGANSNQDKTRRDGLLLEAQRQLNTRLGIGGQYSLTDSEYRDGNFKGNEIPWVARHSASAHLDYLIFPSLKGMLEAIYTGARYLSSDEGHAMSRAGGYTLFNVALTYDYQQLSAKLRVNNLTGKRYESFASYANWVPGGQSRFSAPEEEVQLSVGYRF